MASSEQYGFVFAVSFILIFATILSTIHADFQGQGATADIVTPVNPNLLAGFGETKEFDPTDFIGIGAPSYTYALPDPDGTTWECIFDGANFYMTAHALFLGLWLGGYDWCDFISINGTNYGFGELSFTDLLNDAEEGGVRYNLQFEESGNSAGGFVFWWNTTTYSGPSDAWDNDELYFLHGIGMSANTNIASLLVSLLFLQLPDVPFLINALLVIPMWASIIYILWFIIVNMIPFLGGG